jgi:hypothetical protein
MAWIMQHMAFLARGENKVMGWSIDSYDDSVSYIPRKYLIF